MYLWKNYQKPGPKESTNISRKWKRIIFAKLKEFDADQLTILLSKIRHSDKYPRIPKVSKDTHDISGKYT